MIKYSKYIVKIASLFVMISCHPTPKVSGQFTTAEFAEMTESMAEGGTPDISVDELNQHFSKYILLDARELEEYNVSHIPGSIWIGYEDFDLKRLIKIEKESKIVVYCSVGFRSERIGEKLLEAGYLNTQNLQGSIFEWINKDLPLVDSSNQPTNKIHGFDKVWSKWLKNGVIAY